MDEDEIRIMAEATRRRAEAASSNTQPSDNPNRFVTGVENLPRDIVKTTAEIPGQLVNAGKQMYGTGAAILGSSSPENVAEYQKTQALGNALKSLPGVIGNALMSPRDTVRAVGNGVANSWANRPANTLLNGLMLADGTGELAGTMGADRSAALLKGIAKYGNPVNQGLELASKGIEKGITYGGSGLTGLSVNNFKNVIDAEKSGNSLFGTSKARGAELGNVKIAMVNEGVDSLPKKSATEVSDTIDDMIKKKAYIDSTGNTSLPESDLTLVHEIQDKMHQSVGGVPVDLLNTLKQKIQAKINYNRKEGMTQGENFLKDVAQTLDSHMQDLAKVSPKAQQLIEANKAFSDAAMADQFEKWTPNHLGVRGGVLAGLLPAVHYAGVTPKMEALALSPLILGSSPRLNKYAIQGIGGVNRGYNALSRGIVPALAAQQDINSLNTRNR